VKKKELPKHEPDNSLPYVLWKKFHTVNNNRLVKDFLVGAKTTDRDELLLAIEVMANLAKASKKGMLALCYLEVFKKLNQDNIILMIVHEVSYTIRLNRQRYRYELEAHREHLQKRCASEPRWLTRKEVTEKYLGQDTSTGKRYKEEDLL
jgi:hypothetical protein